MPYLLAPRRAGQPVSAKSDETAKMLGLPLGARVVLDRDAVERWLRKHGSYLHLCAFTLARCWGVGTVIKHGSHLVEPGGVCDACFVEWDVGWTQQWWVRTEDLRAADDEP